MDQWRHLFSCSIHHAGQPEAEHAVTACVASWCPCLSYARPRNAPNSFLSVRRSMSDEGRRRVPAPTVPTTTRPTSSKCFSPGGIGRWSRGAVVCGKCSHTTSVHSSSSGYSAARHSTLSSRNLNSRRPRSASAEIAPCRRREAPPGSPQAPSRSSGGRRRSPRVEGMPRAEHRDSTPGRVRHA